MADTLPGNTTTTQTLAVGTTASSAIDFAGDTDWWKVNLAYGYQYQVWVEGYSSSNGTLIDPYLAAYNSAGTIQTWNDDSSYLTLDSFVIFAPSTTGSYFLSAEESGNNGTGTYKITLTQDELASMASAATVAVNSASAQGHIGWQGDVSDWYAVNLTAGIQYQFDLIGSANDGALTGSTLVDPWLALRNSAGVQLLADDDAGLGQNSRLFFTPSTSGTYYLDAQEYGNDAYGTYRLIVNATPTAGTLTLGTPQTGSVGFPGEVDLFAVSLTAEVTYAFAVDGTTLANPYLEVLNSNGTSLLYYDDDSGPGLNAYLTYTPTTTGTYYLAARASGNNATGSYSARISKIPTVSIADATVVEGDSGTTNLVFTLTLSAASLVPVTVTASTSGTSTASTGIDFVGFSANVTIAAGKTSATFTVQVRGDTVFEPTEVLYVNMTSPEGAVLGDAAAKGTIVNNDSRYTGLPTDGFLPFQWYLYDSTGINVFPVWSSYTGRGIRVAVFDQGVDATNADLSANVLTSLGRNALDLSSGGSPILSGDNHGTAVAGVIAAAVNGYHNVGVAFDAKIVPIYSSLSLNSSFPSEIANAFTYAKNFDVLNNSWGTGNLFNYGTNYAFSDDFSKPEWNAAATALKSLADSGRGGLGTVVVQSAGNTFSVGDDTNLHNFQNSRYIITVGATDYSGHTASYSSPGASILVSAPGGDASGGYRDVLTTDRSGANGYSGYDYAYEAGTSFSSPIVAGIVALMLEANPNLGYRDVQEILAYSARATDIINNTWEYNGATNWNGGGLHYDSLSHDLGFGLVDARAAVRLAETWSNNARTSTNVHELSYSHSPHVAIPDNGLASGAGAGSDSIYVGQDMNIERVDVTLNITHPWIGDLYVLLTSPSGTSSFLISRPGSGALSAYGSSQDNIRFTLDTVLDWGESSKGNWLIGVYDVQSLFVGTLDSWTINFIGSQGSVDDTYIYTDEFSEASADQAARSMLADTGGIDTLNAAACSADLVLNLAAGGVSSIDGRSLTIAVGTAIENAYAGDGNDAITGNSAANVLYGMRGDDRFDGGGGNDTIDGGAGIDTALYSGSRGGFTLTKTNIGFTLTDGTGSAGIDTLQNVERMKFSDGGIALDTGATQAGGKAQLLLGAVLGMKLLSVKKPLIGTVIDLFDQGYTMEQLSGAVMRLPIWDALTGQATPTNTDVARYLLTTVNKTAPDAATVANAAPALDSEIGAAAQGNFLWHLAESSANQTQVGLVGLATTGLEFGG